MNKRLVSYSDTYDLLASNQYSFRAGKSTEDAVMSLVNVDSKKRALGIFLDLLKAFDTVSLLLLFEKLEGVGVKGIALDLFKSYLTDRTQSVVIN